MKIYQDKDEKRVIQCGYCYELGHNKRRCSKLKAHYLANKDFNPNSVGGNDPVGVSKEMYPARYQTYAGDSHAIDQFSRHFDYAKGVHGEKATTAPRVRKKSKCGFCGSEDHNRRNCFIMRNFVKTLEETNQAYRELFYDHVIDRLGIGVGAFVEYGMSNYEGVLQERSIGQSLITKFDLGSIGIGNTFSVWSDYRTNPVIEMGDGNNRSRDVGFILKSFATEKEIPEELMVSGREWSSAISKVIAPAPSKPSKEWFLGQSPAFDWVVKKKSLQVLYGNYWSTIQRYHPDGEEQCLKLNDLVYGR